MRANFVRHITHLSSIRQPKSVITYPCEEQLLKSMMVAPDILHSILLAEQIILSQHGRDSFCLLVLFIRAKLQLSETGKKVRFHMPFKTPFHNNKPLQSLLVIVRIV